MTGKEENAKVPVAGAETSPKKKRGISNNTQAVAQLKFHEKDATRDGLFVGHLDEARVDWSTNADTGIATPRLTFHFASNHDNINERRHVYHTLFPVESNVNTIPGGSEDWKVDNVLKFIKHVLDVFYLKGRQLTDKEEDALALNFCDYDDNNQYIPVDQQEVIDAYAALFNNAVSMLNGLFNAQEGETPKPCYKTANGGILPIYMKLLRHRRRKNDWVNVGNNGDLGFDQFIGAGVIELQKPNTPPSILRIDVSRESITPKDTRKQPTMGIPTMPMGGVMAGAPTDMGTSPQNSAFMNAGAGEEMPF